MLLSFLISMNLLFCMPAEINSGLTMTPAIPSYGSWELVKDKNGVQSYVRWIKVGNKLSTRERKGELTVNRSVQEVTRVLTDPGAYIKWMQGVSENYILESSGRSAWYTYTLFNIPWPFDKRDLVSAYTLTADPAGTNVMLSVCSREDFIPMKPGISRLTNYKAKWIITRLSERITKISFSAVSNTPPVLPRSIQDPVVEKMFHNNLVNLKELLSE